MATPSNPVDSNNENDPTDSQNSIVHVVLVDGIRRGQHEQYTNKCTELPQS